MPYEVQTPVFEGPFDLLLHLILREQVDLYSTLTGSKPAVPAAENVVELRRKAG